MLQAVDYRENKIHTGWLDSRIAMRVRAERPPWYLSVVGGSLFVSTPINAVVDFVNILFCKCITYITFVHANAESIC